MPDLGNIKIIKNKIEIFKNKFNITNLLKNQANIRDGEGKGTVETVQGYRVSLDHEHPLLHTSTSLINQDTQCPL